MSGRFSPIGDKVVSDPLAVAAERDVDFSAALAKLGYNVITMDSAQDLAEKLTAIGADHTFFYRGPEYGKLNHGYLQKFASEPCAKECLNHLLAFLRRQLDQ